jgi:endonuclease/exonuclease/phosphatase (EEP) superfamily protein YafD
VAFQEYTPPAAVALEIAGLGALLPYESAHARGFGLGSALYSRTPLTATGVRKHGSGFWQAQGTLTVQGGRPIAVESVHPCAPIGPSKDDCWFRDLADQPRADPKGGPLRLLLGDFNATVDHAPFRRLLDSGYRDSAEVVGEGLKPTWPTFKWLPGVVLDHVLVSEGIAVRRVQVFPVEGSDHRAVLAEIVVPRT